jgi:hypothetical protein
MAKLVSLALVASFIAAAGSAWAARRPEAASDPGLCSEREDRLGS